MTKIEKYKKEKSEHEYMVSGANKSMNAGEHKRGDRDKYGLYIGSRWHEHGEDIGVLVGYSGFYGNSGCTYEATPRLATYLKKVINDQMPSLVEKAIELSKADLEKTRLDAASEALSVLNETESK